MADKNYFSHFGLEPTFNLDLAALKKSFLLLSRTYHPDFHTGESEESQAENLELSSFNNLAYKTLQNFDLRFKYVLVLHGIDFEEGKQSLPQMFLMEMMDFNEKLMDVQMEGDSIQIEGLKNELKVIEDGLWSDIEGILKNYKFESISASELDQLKNYHLKKKYLLRIHENLNKFGTG